MIELMYLFVRYVILKPLGLVKDDVSDIKKENEWLEGVGYLPKRADTKKLIQTTKLILVRHEQGATHIADGDNLDRATRSRECKDSF